MKDLNRFTVARAAHCRSPLARTGILIVLVAMLALAVCSLGACKPAKRHGNRDRVTIGFSIATDTFIIERWNKDIKIFSGAARDLGADVIVQLSAGGTKEQIAQIDFLMAQGIDVLVVVAHDTDLLAGAVKKVKDAGIPVVAYDRLVMGTPIDAYVSFDNREVGRLFGKALLGKKPRGNYVVVNGSTRDNNSYEVNAGLHEIIDPAAKRQDIRIVDEIWLDEWSSDEALEKIGKVLERTNDVDAISCANDQIASAAIQLLSEYRLAGKVAVVGQDADIGACQKIVEGTQLMTVYKPIASLATRAAKIAVDVAKGAKMSPDRMVENRSGTLIPYFMEEPKAVFAGNMDATVIKDRFHSAEDVYRNVPVKK